MSRGFAYDARANQRELGGAVGAHWQHSLQFGVAGATAFISPVFVDNLPPGHVYRKIYAATITPVTSGANCRFYGSITLLLRGIPVLVLPYEYGGATSNESGVMVSDFNLAAGMNAISAPTESIRVTSKNNISALVLPFRVVASCDKITLEATGKNTGPGGTDQPATFLGVLSTQEYC